MSPAALLRNALRILLPLAVVCTIYLYLYPIFLGCAFPLPSTNTEDGHGYGQRRTDTSAALRATVNQHARGNAGTAVAPFRLLALGDPQLEGDTSIPNAHRDSSFPHLWESLKRMTSRSEEQSLRDRYKQAMHDLVDFYFDDIPDTLESIRKRIDLFGNDFYLAHIYRTLRWWTKPTHVTVLGDLLGSQWIDDDEFEKRSWRFWNRSFKGGERVPDDIAALPAPEYNLAGFLGREDNTTEVWTRRLINIAGNHDVGYAGDLNYERLDRFERVYGKAAYELRFELPVQNATVNATILDPETNPDSTRLPPELRIVVVNNMNLDTPVLTPELQDRTYSFVNDVINTASAVEYQGTFTVVLTHIPLYKPEGVCVDPPFFDFHSDDEGGGLKEQYQLSADASRGFLEGVFGLSGDTNVAGNGRGRRGVILNGHDHEGCDTWHFINQTEGQSPEHRHWEVMRWEQALDGKVPGSPGLPGLRELTVRSMMGGYGGNAGLMSAWFDEDSWEWQIEFTNCALGKQYWWWSVHIFDLIVLGVVLAYSILVGLTAAGLDVDKWPAWFLPSITQQQYHKKASMGKVSEEQAGKQKSIEHVGNGTIHKAG